MVSFKEIADQLEGTSHSGNPTVESLERPGRGSTRIAEIWFEGPADSSNPVICDSETTIKNASASIFVDELSEQLPDLLGIFSEDDREWGISNRASLASDFRYEEPVRVGPHTTVGPEVKLGCNVRIASNVSVRGPATIGDNVRLHAGVRIESPVKIGRNTIVHANTVIGSDGYGFDQTDEGHRKIPQIGGVKIGSEVEIGACSTIDRATYGMTRIGSGTKIDDQVHIAHNCTVGENCLMVGKSGLGGSATIGDGVIIAGGSGASDHVTIADNVIVAGNTGVTKDITEEGAVVSGFPARDHQEQLKIKAAMRSLPELRKEILELRNKEEGDSDHREP